MGLRAQLTIFTGIVLVIVVSVLIASGRKQQDRIFSERVEKETSAYFLPAKKLTLESAHLEKNLIRLEESRILNQKNKNAFEDRADLKQRLVFSDEFYTAIVDAQKRSLPETVREHVDSYVATARNAARYIGNKDFPTAAGYLQNQILSGSDFSNVYLKSLTGLDRRRFRIQTLDRLGQTQSTGYPADTMGISDTYNDALINQIPVTIKVSPQSLYSIHSETFAQQNQRFLVLTGGIARNEEMAFRARQVLSADAARKIVGVLRLDQKYARDLKTAGDALVKRETELLAGKTPKLALIDPDWKKLSDSYAAIAKERDAALMNALHRLAPDSKEASASMDDAVGNLRGALLDSQLILRYDYSAFARGYSGRDDWRKQFEIRYAYLRAWILSGAYESLYPYGATSEAMLFNRHDALVRMVGIDSTPLATLAQQALQEESAGYVRILVDMQKFQDDQTQQRDRMLDTAIAYGLRIFFLVALLSSVLVRRIRTIIDGARLVGQGNLGVAFESTGSDEVSDLARSLDVMVKGLREREELRGEMSAAEEIQKRLLPESMPMNMDGYLSFGTFYKAMMGVGGDYFDLLEAGPDQMAFCIADVSSHGAGPAIIMTMLRAHLHGIIKRTRDVKLIAKELNTRIFADTPANVFITMFLGVFDKRTNEIEAVNAGHNKSIVYRYKTGAIEEFDATALPLGAVDTDLFVTALETQKIKLGAGDLFFQYTDGLNEAMNAADEQYGIERLRKLIQEGGRKKPVVLLEQAARDVEVFTGKPVFLSGPSEHKDDIAMIAFRRIR
ncbi:MAG: SpoIIE family protein phosphatase [Spirochaetia bacterium]|nr:SpoIIE family protein phosphatase [Spirochaetia bacterium]